MADKVSAFGWAVGDIAEYVYRSAKSPKGKVKEVHPGTTKKNAYVIIEPAPAFRFGEGTVKRFVDGIRHTKLTAADMKAIRK